MLDKIKEIKSKYPVPFWILCLVVFPVGIFLLVWFIAGRKGESPSDQEIMDAASKAQGRAEVHEEVAAQSGAAAEEEKKKLEAKRVELAVLVREMKANSTKYREAARKVEDAVSWDDLDKLAGVK